MVVQQYRGKPVLLAELQGDQLGITKKLATPETDVEPAHIGSFGLWLQGGKHVIYWETGAGHGNQIEPRLAWQLTRQLFLDISYRYRRNEEETFDAADSNAIILGLVYNFDRLSISR